MKKIILIIFLCVGFMLFSQTPKSVGTGNAFTSIDTGFDSLLFNPASLVFTERRFGISLFQNLYLSAYNNTFSTADIISMNKNPHITQIVKDKMALMPEGGFEASFSLVALSTMGYVNFHEWKSPVYSRKKQVYSTVGSFNQRGTQIIKSLTEKEITKITSKENEVLEDMTESNIDFDASDDILLNDLEVVLIESEENDVYGYIAIIPNSPKLGILEIMLHYEDITMSVSRDELKEYFNGKFYRIPINSQVSQIEVITDKNIFANSFNAIESIKISV